MTRTIQTLPADDGFAMPAEWAAHEKTWMIWPERTDNWRNGAKPAQAAFAAVAEAIAETEPVTMCVSAAQWRTARRMLSDKIRVVEVSSDDSWIRDCGPTFVLNANGRRRGIDWKFNAWGGLESGLYFPWDKDDQIAMKVIDLEGDDRYAAPFVLEGGSIHVDGEGTLLTTEQCLLNRNRNPGLARSEIERNLQAYLGVSNTIWLGDGVCNDETDGHVDNLCCFARPGVVLLTWTEDKSDPQFDISSDAFARLSKATDAKGRAIEVIKIHQPGPLFLTAEEAGGIDVVEGTQPREAGLRLAASYVNFYLCNGAVIAPLLDPEWDTKAMETLARAFPERAIKGIPAREILLGGGNVHCITQQQPMGR